MGAKILRTILCAGSFFAAHSADAAIEFEITNGQVVSGQNVFTEQTGIVDAGGTISTNGIPVYIGPFNASLTNNGTIIATGADAAVEGVTFNGDFNTVVNNGAISSSSSAGVHLYGQNNTVVNNGTITAGPASAVGIEFTGNQIGLYNYNSATNNGLISVSGANSVGISGDTGTAFATLTNNGKIQASGFEATGIASYGNNSTITNAGNIQVVGPTVSAGIFVAGDNTKVINTGIINVVASGNPNAGAIFLTGNNDTLVLKGNSQINGAIGFTGTNGILDYDVSGTQGGSLIQANGSITGNYTSTVSGLPSNARIATNGNTIAVVTPDIFASSNAVTTQTLSYTTDRINQRQELALLGRNEGVPAGTQVASNSSDGAAGWGIREQNTVWAEGFGSYQERPQSGDTDFSRSRSGGVLTGFDSPSNDEGYRYGVYAGGFAGGIDIGENSFRRIDSTGVLLGSYLGRSFDGYYLSGQLSAGYIANDSDRDVGTAIASADYNSYFVSPSLTIMRAYKGDSVTWVPSATLRYTVQYDDSYQESGSAANESVDSRVYNSVAARAQLEAHLTEERIDSGTFAPTFRAGIEGQKAIGSQSVDLSVLGTNMSFDPTGYDNTVDGILGVNLSYKIDNGPDLYLDAETSLGLNKGGPSDNFGGTGRIGGRWYF